MIRDNKESTLRELVVACKEGSPRAFALGGEIGVWNWLLSKQVESRAERRLREMGENE